MKKENNLRDKSFRFSVRIIRLYQYLTEHKKEYVLSKQLLRAGTSIGANAREADNAVSKPAHHSSLITHHSSLITHHSSLITHHSSLITHHSSLITHSSFHLIGMLGIGYSIGFVQAHYEIVFPAILLLCFVFLSSYRRLGRVHALSVPRSSLRR